MKSVIWNNVRVMKGSELFNLLESNEKDSKEKAEALFKKLNAEEYARGEKLPEHLRNFKIGNPEGWK